MSSANDRQVEEFVSLRPMGNDASENPMRDIKVEKLVLNVRVGESGDRSVRAEKALQQAESRIHTESLGIQEGEGNLR